MRRKKIIVRKKPTHRPYVAASNIMASLLLDVPVHIIKMNKKKSSGVLEYCIYTLVG